MLIEVNDSKILLPGMFRFLDYISLHLRDFLLPTGFRRSFSVLKGAEWLSIQVLFL